jgi:hypothetical protein
MLASAVLLVRPSRMGFNEETAASNPMQRGGVAEHLGDSECSTRILAEFDGVVAALRGAGVDVRVVEDTLEPRKPDAVFPNNWVTTHSDGRVVLYPMCAPNRRLERRADIVDGLRADFRVTSVVDFSHNEAPGDGGEPRFLEGTGSMVFDHTHRVCFAALSPRTDASLLAEVCAALGYDAVAFTATDAAGVPYYHTNVMLSVSPHVAVACLDAVMDPGERAALDAALRRGGRDVVCISRDQVARFAGNMLVVRPVAAPPHGRGVVVASASAVESLCEDQLLQLRRCVDDVVAVPVPTIEAIGGGSVRCMLCELFLPATAV